MAPCPASLISVAGYPDNIPAAVSVPQWAYQDVSSTGGFDVQVAEAAAAKAPPDITQSVPGKTVAPTGAPTGPPIPSASVPAFSAPAFSVPSVSVPAPTFGTGDDFHVHKKTNVGAIVGGVVGGVSTLLAIIGGIWARMRRRANRLAAAAANKPSEEGAAGTPDPEKLHATSPSTAPTQTTQTTEYFPTLPTNGPPPRLYVRRIIVCRGLRADDVGSLASLDRTLTIPRRILTHISSPTHLQWGRASAIQPQLPLLLRRLYHPTPVVRQVRRATSQRNSDFTVGFFCEYG